MRIIDILMNLSTEIIAGIIFLVLGTVISKIPKSIKKHMLKNFFGDAIFSDNFSIVYGRVRFVDKRADAERPLVEKQYQDGRTIRFRGTKIMITGGVVDSIYHLLLELLKYKKNIKISNDEKAISNLEKTFITLGGPVVNEMTDLALKEKSNKYIQFICTPTISRNEPWRLEIDYKGEKLIFQDIVNEGKDYGFILKVRNDRYPNHFFFVCAGIRSWGSSGAAWYLSKNWKKLYKRFKSNEFIVVIKVNRGSDDTAIAVWPPQLSLSK